MQIACELKRSGSKSPAKIQIKDQKIIFEKIKVDDQEEERQKRVDMTKAICMGFMTAPVTIIENGQVTETIEPPLVKRKRLIEEQQKKQREALAKARQAVKEKQHQRKRM